MKKFFAVLCCMISLMAATSGAARAQQGASQEKVTLGGGGAPGSDTKCVQAPGYDCWNEPAFSQCLTNILGKPHLGSCSPVGGTDVWGNVPCRCVAE